MPATMLAWNLQNFGTRYGTDTNAIKCEMLRIRLVTRVVAGLGAQVLVIQEMRRNGVGYLAWIRKNLNMIAKSAGEAEDWHFDWLPGSIATDNSYPVKALSDLDFKPAGNYEGYGVLYRDGFLAKQDGAVSAGQDTSALAGGDKSNFIDLVYQGRPLIFQDNGDYIVIDFRAGRSYVPLNFPRSCCALPNVTRQLRTRTYDTNDVLQRLSFVRRPCVVNWTAPNGALAALPVVVYHAPSGNKGAKSPVYGTLIGFATKQLQEANAIYTGDLNLVDFGFLTAVSKYARDDRGYQVQSQRQDGTFTPTMVHASTPGGAGWRTKNTVYTSPRDLGLGKSGCTVAIPDVLGIIKDTTSSVYTLMKAQQDFITKTVVPLGARFVKNPVGGADVVKAFFSGVYPPNAPYDAMTAQALLYNLLFSDHLPVQFTRPL